MSKKDAIKSKINTLTAVMVVFLTALLAVAGYAFVPTNKFLAENLTSLMDVSL